MGGSLPAMSTLSLHDALPISVDPVSLPAGHAVVLRDREHLLLRIPGVVGDLLRRAWRTDRKSTRLNSSHLGISYAVFCLKKKTSPPPRLICTPDSRRTTSHRR